MMWLREGFTRQYCLFAALRVWGLTFMLRLSNLALWQKFGSPKAVRPLAVDYGLIESTRTCWNPSGVKCGMICSTRLQGMTLPWGLLICRMSVALAIRSLPKFRRQTQESDRLENSRHPLDTRPVLCSVDVFWSSCAKVCDFAHCASSGNVS